MAKFAAKDSNKDITLSPHGTGKVVVGTGSGDVTLQSNGSHNLALQTGNTTTGKINITDDVVVQNDNASAKIEVNNSGEISVTTGTTFRLSLNNSSGDDFIVDSDRLVVEGDTGQVGVGVLDPSELFEVQQNSAGTITKAKIDNEDNTNAGSHSALQVATGGLNSGDPMVNFNNRVSNWTMGMDNSDSDNFKMSLTQDDLATDTKLTIARTGSVTVHSGDLTVSSGTVYSNASQIDNINVNGNTISSTDSNGNIQLSPNGSGTVSITTDLDVDNINVNGNTISSTDVNGNIDITPNGTGEVNISKVDINSGTIDGCTIATSDVTVGSGKTLDVSAGTLTLAANQDGVKTALNASGNPGIFACRAFVNFDGDNAFSPDPSTSAIRSSGNVTSIAETASGRFQINITTAFPNANYAVVGMTGGQTGGSQNCGVAIENVNVSMPTTTMIPIVIRRRDTSTDVDSKFVSIACFA